MILLGTFSHNGCLPMSPIVEKKKKVGGGLGGTVGGGRRFRHAKFLICLNVM